MKKIVLLFLLLLSSCTNHHDCIEINIDGTKYFYEINYNSGALVIYEKDKILYDIPLGKYFIHTNRYNRYTTFYDYGDYFILKVA